MVKSPHHLHRWFDTQRLLSKKTARMVGQGKAVGFPKAGGFAV
jgi:hypothetical protein